MKLLLVAALFGGLLSAQTMISVSALKCASQGTASSVLLVPVGIAGSVAGIPIVTFQCVQLDPAFGTFDKTTTPWTWHPPTASTPLVKQYQEVPAGALNGTNVLYTLSATPASGYPALVYKNGLLQTACSVAGCNGDYLISGTSITFLTASQTSAGASTVPSAGDLLQVVYWH